MSRRSFVERAVVAGTAALALTATACGGDDDPEPALDVITVTGPQPAVSLGRTLPHEHVMVDFIGAAGVSPDRYDRAEVEQAVLPHLEDVKRRGCDSLVECTPAYLGRDVELLRSLADASGLVILTNTGYYGAGRNAYLPAHALEASADELAERWTIEATDGIDGTGIRPGLIKIGVDGGGPLSEVHERLVRAAARTHLRTGLTIASHTPDGQAALDQVFLLRDEGVDPSAWIWVHAQLEPDATIQQTIGGMGAWVEFDGLSSGSVEQHRDLVESMRASNLLDRVLVSHDAGWYAVGEPGGGVFRPYDSLFAELVPALLDSGFAGEHVDRLLVDNPREAFSKRVRAA
jgi:phosphotriesterase-related protein